MALTDVQKIKLEIGLFGEAEDILTDDEISYFLEKNNNNIKKACLDAAKTVLFYLAQLIHERSTADLEMWNHTWYENYMRTLEMYINNPSYSIDITSLKPYCGGVSISDIRDNINNQDNLTVYVDRGIPKDGEAVVSTNSQDDVFNPYTYYKTPFII